MSFSSNRHFVSLAPSSSLLLLKAYKLHDSAEQNILFQHMSKFTQHEQREVRCYFVVSRGTRASRFASNHPCLSSTFFFSDVTPTNHQPRGHCLPVRSREGRVFACSETFGSVVVVGVKTFFFIAGFVNSKM